MAQVRALMSGAGSAPVLESLYATENGNYTPSQGVDGYDQVTVAVPPPVIISKNITANGTYNATSDDADGYSSVYVNVSPSLVTKNITENGTYTAHSEPGAPDGYSSVSVNVDVSVNDHLYGVYFGRSSMFNDHNIFKADKGGSYRIILVQINNEASTYNLTATLKVNNVLVASTQEYYHNYTGSGDNVRNYRISIFDVTLSVNDTVTVQPGSNTSYTTLSAYIIDTNDFDTLEVVKTLGDNIASYTSDSAKTGIILYGYVNGAGIYASGSNNIKFINNEMVDIITPDGYHSYGTGYIFLLS